MPATDCKLLAEKKVTWFKRKWLGTHGYMPEDGHCLLAF